MPWVESNESDHIGAGYVKRKLFEPNGMKMISRKNFRHTHTHIHMSCDQCQGQAIDG